MKYFWVILIAALLLFSGFIWYKFYFVFGEGVKSGVLNYAVKKGNVFKTYEGKLIQQGFGANSKTGSLTVMNLNSVLKMKLFSNNWK